MGRWGEAFGKKEFGEKMVGRMIEVFYKKETKSRTSFLSSDLTTVSKTRYYIKKTDAYICLLQHN